MFALMVILREEDRIQTVLSALIECSLLEATVLDGEAVENLATESVPLFAPLGGLFGTEKQYTRTILASAEDQESIDAFLDACAQEGLDFRTGKSGTVMAWPVTKLSGGSPGGT